MVTVDERDLNKYVGTVLATGVLLSFIILVWGSILYLTHPGAPPVGRTLPAILGGALSLNPSATINLGLLVLLLTPVARIIAAMIGFALERSWKFVLISLTVLIILSISTTVGYFSGRH
jgi:uncharacterized membrane protein